MDIVKIEVKEQNRRIYGLTATNIVISVFSYISTAFLLSMVDPFCSSRLKLK